MRMMTMRELSRAVAIVLPVEHWLELKREAVEDNTSVSAIVRELVSDHLIRRKRRKSQEEGS